MSYNEINFSTKLSDENSGISESTIELTTL